MQNAIQWSDFTTPFLLLSASFLTCKDNYKNSSIFGSRGSRAHACLSGALTRLKFLRLKQNLQVLTLITEFIQFREFVCHQSCFNASRRNVNAFRSPEYQRSLGLFYEGLSINYVKVSGTQGMRTNWARGQDGRDVLSG